MKEAEFDPLAGKYRNLHAENIAISGEQPDYFADYKMRDFVAMLAKKGRSSTGRYLDFGSGIGASVAPFLKRLPQATLVCADVSRVSLDESRLTHGDAVEYLPIEDGCLALPDRSLDGAFACCVFHHIPPGDHAGAFAELRRVLKPGAPLMVYEHNPLNPLTVRAVKTCALDENAVLISAREMRRRCESAGFRDAHVFFRVFFPAALRWMRPLENRLAWLPLGAQYAVHARA